MKNKYVEIISTGKFPWSRNEQSPPIRAGLNHADFVELFKIAAEEGLKEAKELCKNDEDDADLLKTTLTWTRMKLGDLLYDRFKS